MNGKINDGFGWKKDTTIKWRHIIEFAIFLLLILFIFVKVTWLFRNNGSGSRERMQGFRKEKNIDVVVIGGSNVFRYFQPLQAYNEMGFTSYDYATSSAKVDNTKYFLDESRKSTEALVYVVDVRTVSMLDNRIEPMAIRNFTDSINLFSLNRIEAISSYLFSRQWDQEDIPSYYLDMIYYHSTYDVLKEKEKWMKINMGGIYCPEKGYLDSSYTHPFNEPRKSEKRGELSGRQKDILSDILDYCDNNELNVLFIVNPYIISEEDWAILNTTQDYIEQRGYPFINFNNYYKEIGFDFETDFADCNHVNNLGAEKYTSFLAHYLCEHYDLPDHRQDRDYVSWNEQFINNRDSHQEWTNEAINLANAMRAAKNTNAHLSEKQDFEDWYMDADSEYNSFIVTKHGTKTYNNKSLAFTEFIDKLGIVFEENNYTCLYSDGEFIFQSYTDEEQKGEVGLVGGISGNGAQASYVVRAGLNPSIIIDDEEYVKDKEGIHVVVFDNYYMNVCDSVTLNETPNGEIILSR